MPREEHRSARPERRYSAGFRGAAAVLRREGLLREVVPFAIPAAVQPGSLMALRRVRTEALHPVQAEAAGPAALRPAVLPPAVLAAVRCPARPSVVAAQMVQVPQRAEVSVAQPLVAEPTVGLQPAEQPGALAEAAAEVQREEEVPPALAARPKVAPGVLAEWDAAAEPQPAVASGAAGVRQPEEAAVQGVAVAALPQGVARAVAAAVRQPGAVQVAEVRRRVVRGAQGEPLSAPAWAAVPLSTRLRGARPAPSPPARSAHAKERLRIAQP